LERVVEVPEVVLPPEVKKTVSPEEIMFGSEEIATVTINVTGAGGTETTIEPMDVVFAIDSSGSMGGPSGNDPSGLRLTAAKAFVDKMVDTRDQAGVVSWDAIIPPTWPDGIDFAFGLTNDFDDTDGVKYWIDLVDAYGGTDLDLGLNAAIEMLDSTTQADAARVIIFLTDGQGGYTYSSNPGSPADDAAGKGYIIYSIGLGSPSAVPLMDMATATGGAYYSSPSADNLQAIYDAIYEEIVTSSIPHYVNVTEVTQSYIVVDEDSFNYPPDEITHNPDGTTTIFWENIGMYLDDDPDLSADEIVLLTFDIKSKVNGTDLEIDVYEEAVVDYGDKDGNYVGSIYIPQAYITVHPFVTDLIAGGGGPESKSAIDVGEVIIWTNDPDFLYITYETTDGWEMTETHLHVAAILDGIPQTKKFNPIPGHFDYIEYHDPAVQTYTIAIPWTWDPGTTLYIAAHAEVQKIIRLDDCENPIYQEETAWGEGLRFNEKNWAMYFMFVDP
jgi:Ca-activated chloride channel family protein